MMKKFHKLHQMLRWLFPRGHYKIQQRSTATHYVKLDFGKFYVVVGVAPTFFFFFALW